MEDQIPAEQVVGHESLSILLGVSLLPPEGGQFRRLEDQGAVLFLGSESEGKGGVVRDLYSLGQEIAGLGEADETVSRLQTGLTELAAEFSSLPAFGLFQVELGDLRRLDREDTAEEALPRDVVVGELLDWEPGGHSSDHVLVVFDIKVGILTGKSGRETIRITVNLNFRLKWKKKEAPGDVCRPRF